ncbi:sulfate transporter family protein [Mycobacterium xenopi 3993]|nr:sulfate transporter family protein [Mycobacterium xenopi 3993]
MLDALQLRTCRTATGAGRDRRGDRGADRQRGKPVVRGCDRPYAHRPRTDFNRELIGQGTANIASGVIGGLPITGVIVRSSTNIHAGAKSRASAILHGVWVLLFSLPFAGWSNRYPPRR